MRISWISSQLLLRAYILYAAYLCICVASLFIVLIGYYCRIGPAIWFSVQKSKSLSFVYPESKSICVHRLYWVRVKKYLCIFVVLVVGYTYIKAIHYYYFSFFARLFFHQIYILLLFLCYFQTDISTGRCQWKSQKQRQKERSKTVEERAKPNKAR